METRAALKETEVRNIVNEKYYERNSSKKYYEQNQESRDIDKSLADSLLNFYALWFCCNH